jgi:hypothetical protein
LGKAQTSIFARLGGKKEIDDMVEENRDSFTGILKNSSKKVSNWDLRSLWPHALGKTSNQ